MADDTGVRSSEEAMTSVGCPACGVEVVSASLGRADLLERHLRYCSWEPSKN